MTSRNRFASLGLSALLCIVGASAGIGCDDEPETRTAGQEIDRAQEKLENAAEKAGEKTKDAAKKVEEGAEKAAEKTREVVRDAKD